MESACCSDWLLQVRSGSQAHVLWKRLDALKHDDVYAHRLKEPLTEEERQKMGEFLRAAHVAGAEYDYAQASASQKRLNQIRYFESSYAAHLPVVGLAVFRFMPTPLGRF